MWNKSALGVEVTATLGLGYNSWYAANISPKKVKKEASARVFEENEKPNRQSRVGSSAPQGQKKINRIDEKAYLTQNRFRL